MTGIFPHGVAALWLTTVIVAFSSCTTTKPAAEVTTPVEPARRAEPGLSRPAPQSPQGTGRTNWAAGFIGQLVRGMDGKLYPPYRPATIKRVQSLLKERGLYAGPVNGVLDAPTMQSVYAFQRANPVLRSSGVPTPMTRKLLQQGSHTDPA